ncbi:helix-turn-helix transcriptional regulator [Aliivibrio sp. S3MY1]|uniref:helix-turn-helix transcriptional regulator n=1 Tax=Aliivibrio sp. S3MY1 TaxID=3028424 RepID=UPI0023795AFE|nr:helix-turn-helix transcriptional regulator [Aliivibrio sp. S3MY1]MDD9196109.1 helix-turn-helix transcriptional regulator [Aliivibrio sp. S3MY1]
MSNSRKSSKESVSDVINRLRDNRKSISDHNDEDNNHDSKAENISLKVRYPQRVSKKITPAKAIERTRAINQISKQLLFGELTQGQALKELRINVLGLKQDIYAKLVDVSRKTLSDIENDRGNYKTDILDKVFKPTARAF